jgi:hypothetical protein
MATIINSSTNPQGLIQTSDGTAVLKIQTGGNDAIVFDESQNVTVNNDLIISGDVRFSDADSSNYVALQAPTTIATNFTLTLPTTDGTANQALITDGSGNLSFANVVAEAVAGESFHPFLLSGM